MQIHSTWIVGAGYMGREYARVLKGLNVEFVVVGRGETNIARLTADIDCPATAGGLDKFLSGRPEIPQAVIVATNIDYMTDVMKKLLEYGVKHVLLEKPGAVDLDELTELERRASAAGMGVFLAYNRRFYSSVRRAREIILADGGVTSFSFEFTEWVHDVDEWPTSDAVKKHWLAGNSSHVIDMAFYMGGCPQEVSVFTAGSLHWHPDSCVFAGAGRSEGGALFTYQANWDAPGRWVVEMLTTNYRLIFRPLEELRLQRKNSSVIEDMPIDCSLDKQFKPGLYLQTRAFLGKECSELKTLAQQKTDSELYFRMANYTK